MASVSKRPSGFVVQFYLNTQRRTLSFNNSYSRSEIEEIARHIDKCVDAITREVTPDKKTLAWLTTLPVAIKQKLERAGLIEEDKSYTLGELFNEYVSSDEFYSFRPRTQIRKHNTIKVVLDYFGDVKIDDISKNDARLFSDSLADRYAPATRATYIRDIKRIFNWAITLELIDVNPFTILKRGTFKNKKREHYISLEDYFKVLECCESQETRAALALYRIGGLRKGEAYLLQWADVDFKANRITVRSPKTERFNKDSRVIPLFPQLKDELAPLYKRRKKGAVLTENETTVYNRFNKAIKKAGLERWERLVQNLRSSRAIDVYKKFGALAEKEWIGHTEQIAQDHYLHLLESDFNNAVNEQE